MNSLTMNGRIKMIKWLIDNWTCIFLFIGIGFMYFFVFAMCSVSHEADERAENDIAMMRMTQVHRASEVGKPQ